MKAQDLQVIRATELVLLLSCTSIASLSLSTGFTPEQVSEVLNNMEAMPEYMLRASQALSQNKDIGVVSSLISASLYAEFLGGAFLDSRTEEAKKITSLYHQSVDNTAELMKNFALDEPISVFAMYVYLYRNGYLSSNQKFIYSMKLKDIPKNYGADVIGGYGVCRSVAEHLTDIYQKLGYASDSITVNATKKSIAGLDKLCPTIVEKDPSGARFAKFISTLTGKIRISNHMITLVRHEGKSYVLDGMNDGILIPQGRKLVTPNNPTADMIYSPVSLLINRAMGMVNKNSSLREINETLKMPTIDMQEYRRIYLETLKMCRDNEDLLEQFYLESAEIYDEISSTLEKVPGMIRRKIPFIPSRRK